MPLLHRVRCPACSSEVSVRIRSGRHSLLEILGSGGAGKVFGAFSDSGERIALKVLERDHPEYGEHLALLRNEAVTAPRIAHQRIVRVLFLEEDGEGARLGMEWMRGGSLHELIASLGSLGEQDSLAMILQVLKGLAAAHDVGVIHRDLKPANILLTETSGAKLSDFGLALGQVTGTSASPHLLATPDYVAPEILDGFPGDPASDLYGLGGCLFHALTGKPPHPTAGLSLAELRRVKRRRVRVPPGTLSGGVEALLGRLLDPDRSRRFGSARELESALLALLTSGEPRPSGGLIVSLAKRVRGILGKAGRGKA
jgi:serine/threonine protein kinase